MDKPISEELLEHLQQHRKKTLQPPPEPEWQDSDPQWSETPDQEDEQSA